MSPLLASNILLNKFSSTVEVGLGDVEASDSLNVAPEFLVSLVVSVVERSSLEVDNSGTSVHVVDGSGQSDFGTESVTTHGSHSQLVLIHKSSDVVGDVLQESGDEVYLRSCRSSRGGQKFPCF